jgi:hypothetical protein
MEKQQKLSWKQQKAERTLSVTSPVTRTGNRFTPLQLYSLAEEFAQCAIQFSTKFNNTYEY